MLALTGCSPAQKTAATSIAAEQLVAEASIRDHRGGTHVFLPITLQGHPLTALLDLGATITIVDGQSLAQLGNHRKQPGVAVADSLRIGTSIVRHVAAVSDPLLDTIAVETSFPDLPRVAVLLGTDVLSRYDFLFDGPARRVRLYAPRSWSTSAGNRPTWFPPGIRPADCIVGAKMNGKYRYVGLPVHVRGRRLFGFFDSGSPVDAINLATARQLGVTVPGPNVHRDPKSGELVWSGVTVQMGHQTLTNRDVFIMTPADTEELGGFTVGLGGIRDQLLWVSYSTGQVCLSAVRSARISP